MKSGTKYSFAIMMTTNGQVSARGRRCKLISKTCTSDDQCCSGWCERDHSNACQPQKDQGREPGFQRYAQVFDYLDNIVVKNEMNEEWRFLHHIEWPFGQFGNRFALECSDCNSN